MSKQPTSASLWDLYLAEHDLPADTPMPTQLDAYRRHRDGLKHCRQCGGIHFAGVLMMDETGAPVEVLRPQKCVGCGAIYQNDWSR